MADYPWLKNYAPGVDWHAEIEKRPLPALMDESVARFGDRPCVDFLDKKFTYQQIGRMIDRAAKGFQDLGVTKGVKVGMFLPNCPQFIVAYHGVLKAGGTVVNFSPLYSEEQLLHQIEDSHTDIMVTLHLKALYPKMELMLRESRLQKLVVGTLSEVLPFPKNLLFPVFKRGEIAKVPNDAKHVSFQELMNNEGDVAPVEIDVDEDIAVLQYTGGTTGVSKGAMLTHGNISANIHQAALWFPGARPGEEKMMGVLPFFHVFAMTVVMNYTLHIGGEIIMHPRFVLEDVMKAIPQKKPTMMPGVPTMYTALASHPAATTTDMSSIHSCMSGGAPLPVEVKQRFEQMTGAKVFEGYGLTETSPIASSNPLNGVNKPGSIGQPSPRTIITIYDRDDPEKEMPLGESGEICIEGPQVMKGYWNREEETAKAMQGGRLHTGDVGYMDEDGYTFIIDRIKDLVLVGGFNVFPRHVEESIYEHPAVDEVTVIGIPDDYTGQAVKAFVKLKEAEDIDEEKLKTFLKSKLGKHEMPKHIEFRDELPKTMIGKLSKKELVAEEVEKYEAAKGAAE